VPQSGLGANFWRFWSAAAVSQLGDGMRVTALPLLAAAITSDPFQVAMVSAAVWAPWLVFGVIGGVVVDRVDRRRLMRTGQLLRFLVVGGLAAAVLGGLEEIWLLLLVAFLIGVGEVFVDSSLQAVVPQLVQESNLDTANARLGTAELVGNELGGPPLGGFLFGIGHAVPFIGDAISFGLSGLLLGTVRGDFRSASDGRPVQSAWRDVKEGTSYLLHNQVLRSIAISIAFPNLGFVAFGGVYVLFAKQILHVGALGFGLILSAGAVGGLLGTLIANRITPRLGRGRSLIVSLAVAGLASAAIGLTSSAIVAAALGSVIGVMIAVTNVAGRSLRHILTPNRLLGRVVSASRVIGYGTIPFGAALGGWLASSFGLRVPFFVGGGITFLAALGLAGALNERRIEEARARMASVPGANSGRSDEM
jgi:MFS family permease